MTSPAPRLEPCPFCGDSALLQGLGEHNVICTNCNVLTPDFPTAEEAIAAWNTRPDTAARAEAREAAIEVVLRECRQELADQIEADVDFCCPHMPDGTPIESEMDALSRPRIEASRALLARIDAALARPATQEKDHG